MTHTKSQKNCRRAATDVLARDISRALRAMANPARAQGVQNYFKHSVVALGIDAPTMRDYARTVVKNHQLRESGLSEGIALCDRLLTEAELEIRGMGILLLSACEKEFSLKLLIPAEEWLNSRLDNWALVDSFCSSVLSPLFAQHPEVATTLRAWSSAPSLWVRRAALVTLVPFSRRGRYLDLAYELAAEHFADTEDLMHKATGWLLREAGKTDMARLRKFLRKKGFAIPRTAVRYAIEKFSPAERAQLLAVTRTRSGKT
jgi:3-methyladenine DNA glycosylase AlkD